MADSLSWQMGSKLKCWDATELGENVDELTESKTSWLKTHSFAQICKNASIKAPDPKFMCFSSKD